jgi:hypothetical protein
LSFGNDVTTGDAPIENKIAQTRAIQSENCFSIAVLSSLFIASTSPPRRSTSPKAGTVGKGVEKIVEFCRLFMQVVAVIKMKKRFFSSQRKSAGIGKFM